ncbi:SH3 domain-containing protein [Roseovarius sp.]|uniref:SH3 domain-containing protein n=1 Tax=Roseovarius sp. TaxID=1486281 RepID=UPI003BAB0A92
MRGALVLFLCLWLLPSVSPAQTLPAIYDVSGVAANDTLNVRSGPSTDHGVIAKLSPDATGIEVIDADKTGEWGLINTGEASGWVALRYMARQPGQPDTGLARNLACSGTEPFCSFNLTPDRKAEMTRLETTVPFADVLVVPSANRPDRHALFADGGDTVVTAMVGRNQCSDGMSDRAYGLGIDLLVTDKTEVKVYSGCCSVAP